MYYLEDVYQGLEFQFEDEYKVIEVRPSKSRSNLGIVSSANEVTSQKGETVFTLECAIPGCTAKGATAFASYAKGPLCIEPMMARFFSMVNSVSNGEKRGG